MATNTPNLNLVKPDLTDFADIRVLNGNMDILDGAVGGLDYVKDVTKSDTGLTFTKKDDTVVNVPLDYMPTAGGNFTGNITVQNNQVVCIADTVTTETQTSIKYSDGRLVQWGTINHETTANAMLSYTFATPFTDSNYLVFTTYNGDRYYPNGNNPNTSHDTNAYISQAGKTNTSCIIQCDDYALSVSVLAIGRWK